MRLEHGELASPGERRLSRQAVEHDTSERVHVRSCVELPALDLFRCAIVGGSEEEARLGGRGRAHAPRQAEVAQIDMATRLREQDVCRLHIPVDEAGCMSRIESTAHLFGDTNRLLGERIATHSQELVQARARDVAHGEKQNAVRVAGIEDGNDVRMVERSSELGLAQEASPELVVVRELGRDDLERRLPLEAIVRSEVDGPHPATSQQRLERVPAERVAQAWHSARHRHRARLLSCRNTSSIDSPFHARSRRADRHRIVAARAGAPRRAGRARASCASARPSTRRA